MNEGKPMSIFERYGYIGQKWFLGRHRELLGRHKRSIWADTGVCPYENDGGMRPKGQEHGQKDKITPKMR